MPQLLVALRRNPRKLLTLLAEFFDCLRLAFQTNPVPPGSSLEVQSSVRRKIDIIGMMQSAPGFGSIKRMVRIRKGSPKAKWPAAVVAQIVYGSIAYPR